jgi:mannosyltransferase
VLLAYRLQFHQRVSKDNQRYRHISSIQGLLPILLALLFWLFIPTVVSYVVSQGSLRLFSSRYLVVIVPALCLLVGLGLEVLPWRVAQITMALVVLLLALSTAPFYYRSAQVEDWNSPSLWVEQHFQSGDGLVCFDNAVGQGCQISVEYYLHAYPSAAQFSSDAPGAFSWTNFGPVNATAGYNAAVDPAILGSYAAKHPHLFLIVGRVPNDKAAAQAQAAQQWLNSHYHLIGQIVTRSVTVFLYATSNS